MIPKENETLKNCPDCRKIKCICPMSFGAISAFPSQPNSEEKILHKDCCYCHPDSYGWRCECKCHSPKPEEKKWTCPCGKDAQPFECCSEKCEKEYCIRSFNDTSDEWEKEFGEKMRGWKFHHNSVPCVDDEFAVEEIKSFIKSLLSQSEQRVRKEVVQAIKEMVEGINDNGGGSGRRFKIQLLGQLDELMNK